MFDYLQIRNVDVLEDVVFNLYFVVANESAQRENGMKIGNCNCVNIHLHGLGSIHLTCLLISTFS